MIQYSNNEVNHFHPYPYNSIRLDISNASVWVQSNSTHGLHFFFVFFFWKKHSTDTEWKQNSFFTLKYTAVFEYFPLLCSIFSKTYLISQRISDYYMYVYQYIKCNYCVNIFICKQLMARLFNCLWQPFKFVVDR